MGIQKSLIVQLALIVVSFSSCGPEAVLLSTLRKKENPAIDVHVSDYSKASCEFDPEQGDLAPSILPSVSFVTTYFGKKYDENLLKAVLSTSATETVRFAQKTNVDFFSVSRYKSDSCLMASFLPEAHVFYQAQFESVGKGVLGLYLSPKNSLVEKTNEKPTILVRRDVSRWVLIHEFMHHLFSKEIQDIGDNDEDLKSKVKKADDELKSLKEKYKASQTVEDGKKMLEAIKILVSFFPELLKRFTLEEMTIETVLAEKLTQQELKNVPENQAINGAAYIYTSAEKAEMHLLKLSTEALTARYETMSLQEKLNEEDFQNYRVAFKTAEEIIDQYRSELKNLKRRAETTLRRAGVDPEKDLSGFLDVYAAASNQSGIAGDHQHVGCSHAKMLETYKNF